MATFKPMFSRTPARAQSVDINTVCEPGSDFIWINNKLPNPDVFTEIRMLPVIDEDGEEELALNPEGGASEEKLPTTLSTCFACMEIGNVWQNGQHTFVTAVKPYDRSGDPAPGGRSPVMAFMRKVGYKVYEQLKKQELGLDTDIPAQWFAWREHNILNKPQNMYLVRALTKYIAGEPVLDAAGNAEWIAGVFAIPKSAETAFLQKICSHMDPTEALSTENNEFGDFCTCEGGHTLRLKRYDNVDNGKRTKTTYSLNLGRKFALKPEVIKQYIKPWEELIHIPTVDESIETLCKLFTPEAVDFAFRDSVFARYIPESMVGAGKDISEPEDTRKLTAAKPKAPANTMPNVNDLGPALSSDDYDEDAGVSETDKNAFKSMANALKSKTSGGFLE